MERIENNGNTLVSTWKSILTGVKTVSRIFVNILTWLMITFLSTLVFKFTDYIMIYTFKDMTFLKIYSHIINIETMITFSFTLGIYTIIYACINSERRRKRTIIGQTSEDRLKEEISINGCKLSIEMLEAHYDIVNIDLSVRNDSGFFSSLKTSEHPLVYEQKRTHSNSSVLRDVQGNILMIEFAVVAIMIMIYLVSKGDYSEIEFWVILVSSINLITCIALHFSLEGFKWK